MNRNYLAAYGVLTLILSPLAFSIASLHADPSKLRARGSILLLAMIFIGFGLIFRRKWAALYFSVPLALYGIQETFFSIEQVTFPLNLLVMLHGLSFTLPLVVTIRIWKYLTWGGRFF